MATSQGGPVTAFAGLPTRLYVDTSTLQAVFDYGDLIWENEEPVLSTRAKRRSGNFLPAHSCCCSFFAYP